jgi:DDE_Tnp_1-associated
MTLQEPSSGPGAQNEAFVFLSFFADLPDPRQAGKVIYPLPEVLLLCLLAVLAGAENFVEIARFGQKKIELLRRFLPFKGGTPSHDQLCDIFAMIDATHFQRCFVAWVAKMFGVATDVIAIDGKIASLEKAAVAMAKFDRDQTCYLFFVQRQYARRDAS